MAKNKSTESKSSVIREYLSKHPDASAPDIVAALGKQGVTVTQGTVN